MFGEKLIIGSKLNIKPDSRNRITVMNFTGAETGEELVILTSDTEEDTYEIHRYSDFKNEVEILLKNIDTIMGTKECIELKKSLEDLCKRCIDCFIWKEDSRIQIPRNIYSKYEKYRVDLHGCGNYLILKINPISKIKVKK